MWGVTEPEEPAAPTTGARQLCKGRVMTGDATKTGQMRPWHRWIMAGASLLALAACEGNSPLSFLQGQGATQQAGAQSRSVRLVERDVEAPEVFQVTEAGLWDGRPSLGGVWVAHPDVTEPERVLIRNTANGNFVIGALFRREVDTPGPRVQVSSDAAATLGMLAGQPVSVNVTALRREEVADPQVAAAEAAPDSTVAAVPAPAGVTESRLDPVAASGAGVAAVSPPPANAPRAAAAPAPAAAPAAAAPPRASSLDRPYLQIGIFSVEANANRAATAMRNAGMVPEVRRQTSQGKDFWRVLVGPAATSAERATLLEQIKQEGFTDAYAVTN